MDPICSVHGDSVIQFQPCWNADAVLQDNHILKEKQEMQLSVRYTDL